MRDFKDNLGRMGFPQTHAEYHGYDQPREHRVVSRPRAAACDIEARKPYGQGLWHCYTHRYSWGGEADRSRVHCPATPPEER